jgi:hypothetical protein
MNNKLTQEAFIKNALEYYDENQVKINKMMEKFCFIKWDFGTNTSDEKSNTNNISFYDDDKKLILSSAYEFMGMYIPNNNTWKWAWAIPSFHKNNTYISRQILSYAFDLTAENDYLLKSQLINSTIKIYDDIQLDINTAIVSNLSKKTFIYKYHVIPTENVDGYHTINKNIDENIYKNSIIMYLFIVDY